MDASRRGSRRRRHLRWLSLTIGLGSFALAVVVTTVWFQPQKLWIDKRVSEPKAVELPSSEAPVAVSRGEFISREHRTVGTAQLVRLAEGRHVVRLEGLETSNGPDLYVYLSDNRARGRAERFDDAYVSLGRLKGNLGDQTYDVPAGTDVERLATVVIWCDRFNAVFGAADLVPA